jgi:hypothetical protein
MAAACCFVQPVLLHVALFVGHKGLAVGLVVERKAHLVQGIALLGLVAVERCGAGNGGKLKGHGVSPMNAMNGATGTEYSHPVAKNKPRLHHLIHEQIR